MEYAQQMQAGYISQGLPETAAPSLSAAFDTNLKRLSEIEAVVAQLGDMIHGPSPKPAGSAGNTPRPMPSYASRVRDLGEIIDNIEAGLRRIANGI